MSGAAQAGAAASAAPFSAAPLSAPLLPVSVAPAVAGGGPGGGSRRGPDEERPRNSWEVVVGGLGGLAQKYDPSQSVSTLVASRDAAWERAMLEDEDRRLSMQQIEQGFDGTGVEQASMEQHLPESNRGYVLLKKMGWREQTGLGRRSEGRVDPVRVSEQYAQLGLGKASEYDDKAEEATESRKAMTTELIAYEDELGRRQREEQVAKEEGIRDKLREETDVFYCDVCDKRYVKVKEFENHLSSYDHHHRKRFKEMREAEKARNKSRAPLRKEKKDPALIAAEAAAAAAAAAGGGPRSSAPPAPPPAPPAQPAPPAEATSGGWDTPSAPRAASGGWLGGGGAPQEAGSSAEDEKQRRRQKLEAWKAQQAAQQAPAASSPAAAEGVAAMGGSAGAAGAEGMPKAAKFGGMAFGGGKATLGGGKLGAPKGKPLSKPSAFTAVEDDT